MPQAIPDFTADLFTGDSQYQLSKKMSAASAQHGFSVKAKSFPYDTSAQHYAYANASSIGTPLLGSWSVKRDLDMQELIELIKKYALPYAG
ncbi:MAG: hypothetical protein NVSMB7_03000 [Chitinophagaceae bacterium]